MGVWGEGRGGGHHCANKLIVQILKKYGGCYYDVQNNNQLNYHDMQTCDLIG